MKRTAPDPPEPSKSIWVIKSVANTTYLNTEEDSWILGSAGTYKTAKNLAKEEKKNLILWMVNDMVLSGRHHQESVPPHKTNPYTNPELYNFAKSYLVWTKQKDVENRTFYEYEFTEETRVALDTDTFLERVMRECNDISRGDDDFSRSIIMEKVLFYE